MSDAVCESSDLGLSASSLSHPDLTDLLIPLDRIMETLVIILIDMNQVIEVKYKPRIQRGCLRFVKDPQNNQLLTSRDDAPFIGSSETRMIVSSFLCDKAKRRGFLLTTH